MHACVAPLPGNDRGSATRGRAVTTDAPQPETPDDTGVTQPADPFEPEAPAHVDPDPEAVADEEDVDDEAAVEGADPTPPQPS